MTHDAAPDLAIEQHIEKIEKVMLDVHMNPDKYQGCKQTRSDKTMQVSEQFLIGRTIGRTARPKAGQEDYYKRHNMADRQHEIVYIRPISESGKPAWQKKLYYDHLKPLIEKVDPEYATDEDYGVQVSVYDSDKGDFCKQHTDSKDIAPQIMMCLGNFSGGELRLTLGDSTEDVTLKNHIVKLDARLPHEVLPFEGVRISVIFYKRYDRHIKTPLPITEDVTVLHGDCEEPQGPSLSGSDELEFAGSDGRTTMDPPLYDSTVSRPYSLGPGSSASMDIRKFNRWFGYNRRFLCVDCHKAEGTSTRAEQEQHREMLAAVTISSHHL
eukprot:SAG11_NODE_3717_length_2262_cov_4.740638_1_plen_324_part_10